MIHTCNIAFVYRGRVLHNQLFHRNDEHLMENIRAAALTALNGGHNDGVVLMFKRADGAKVELGSHEESKMVFEAERATIRIKKVRVRREAEDDEEKEVVSVKEKKPRGKKVVKAAESEQVETKAEEDHFSVTPFCHFVDVESVFKLCEFLEVLSDKEEVRLEVKKAVEMSVMKKRSFKRLMHSIGRVSVFKGAKQAKWVVAQQLEALYDAWIEQVPEEQLTQAADQVMQVVDLLIKHRNKLNRDIFEKQKPLSKIIKLKVGKTDLVDVVEVEQVIVAQDAEETKRKHAKKGIHDGKPAVQVEKQLKREQRLAQEMEKYGCETLQELKEEKRQARIAKMLEKHGCNSMEELRAKRLEKKLEKYGCKTVEELKALKKAKRLVKRSSKQAASNI